MFEMIQPLDNSILLWIQENLHSSILDTLMVAYTTLGNASLMWLLIAAIMVYFPKSRKAGIMVLFALILGYLLNNEFLKELIERPRPWVDLAGLEPLIHAADPNSFPSGHTCSAFAAAGIICRTLPKKWGLISVIAAVLMGFSRMYVGVHYFSDVLVGAAIGILCSQIIYYLFKAASAKTNLSIDCPSEKI